MKVYVKKEDKESIIPGIIVTIVFLSFSIGVFIYAITSGKMFIDILESLGITLVFAIIFFGFGMYFVYAMIKKPIAFKSKLINKKNQTYNGKQITYMKFRTQKEKEQEEDFISSNYNCYTIGENALIVGNDYSLKIKEFNWEPKYVEELNILHKNKIKNKIPNMTLSPIFFTIGLIFAAQLFLCILGIIMYPIYKFTYMFLGIFSTIALIMTFKANKKWKLDNNIEQNKQNLNLTLQKIKPINNNKEKVGNIIIKHFFILLIILPIVWFMIISKMNIEKESFMLVYSMILFVELPIIIMILCNIGYDKRLIKKHKINIKENVNIFNMNYFNIFRPTKNTTFPQYFITDQDKNLILKIKKSNFIGNKFAICNPYDIKIGEIKLKLFNLTNEFIVNIINESPFIIRSKMQLHSNYQIIGRDYYVKGDPQLIRNIIYDNGKNDIAYISAVSKNNNNWHELGNTDVVLNNNINNNIDIMIIALCITMGNFQTFNRRMNL